VAFGRPAHEFATLGLKIFFHEFHSLFFLLDGMKGEVGTDRFSVHLSVLPLPAHAGKGKKNKFA
jgi:hypothetical protein